MNSRVPEGWQIRQLHEICDDIFVGHVGSTAKHYTDFSGIKFIRTGDLKNGKIRFSDTKYITKEFHQKLVKSKLKPGDILVSRVGDTGQAAIVPKEIGEANCANIIIIRPAQSINPEFLLSTINSEDFFNQTAAVSIGSAQAVLNISVIKKLRILVPPIPEQKKITEILSGIDHLIEVQLQNIEKLNALKTAEINKFMISNKDKSVPLKKIAKCQGGFAFKSLDSKNEGVKWLKIANVSIGKLNWDDESFLPNNFQEKYAEFVLKEKDIVIAMTRPVIRNQLKVAMISNSDQGSLLNQRVGRIIPKENIIPDYLFLGFQFDGFVRQIKDVIAGSDPPNVSSSQIESLLIPLPEIEEQMQIASFISSIESLIDKRSKSLRKIQSLKVSISQELLSGFKRVNI